MLDVMCETEMLWLAYRPASEPATVTGWARRYMAVKRGCTEDAARNALAQAGGRTKLAVLLLNGIDADEAGARLAQCNGQLGAALRG